MKCLLLILSFLAMFNVSEESGNAFKIKIGNAKLEGIIPGERTKRAPDLAIDKEFDICSWLEDENNQQHNAQKELFRKLWEFKRIFKAPHGSLVFTVSIANNLKFKSDLKSYYEWVGKRKLDDLNEFKQRGYVDHNYTPVEGFKEISISGNQWVKYHANNNSSFYYRTFLNDHVILRINLIQSDNRKKAVKGMWHPEAKILANEIIESIKLSLPSDGALCKLKETKGLTS